MVGDRPAQAVGMLDLEPGVRKWLGGDKWLCTVDVDLRILPDGTTDIVKRLTKVPKARCRVVPSKRKAVVLGGPRDHSAPKSE